MTKIKFLMLLKDRLSSLPEAEVEERLNFYSEMIEDRVEEGLSEAAAVIEVGTVDEIAAEIIDSIPLMTIVKEKIKPKRAFKGWEIALIALGFPVWGSLLISTLAVVFSLYVCVWSVVVSLWAVFVSLAASGPLFAIGGGVIAFSGNALPGIAVVGCGLSCAALAIFLFFGCRAATVGTVKLTRKILKGVKKSFVKGEGAK